MKLDDVIYSDWFGVLGSGAVAALVTLALAWPGGAQAAGSGQAATSANHHGVVLLPNSR